VSLVAYDTETTGLPEWKIPSDDPSQPHIIQLGALLVADNREVVAEMDVIVKPDGWIIPDDTVEVHGITMEQAMDAGIPETDAVDQFIEEFWKNGTDRVAHNRTFDQRLIRIALKRYGYPDDLMELWADKDTHFCTMLMAKPLMKLEPRGRYGYKSPKLEEAYLHFIGEELNGAHNAMNDAKACLKIYWCMIDQAHALEAAHG
jgi:DNA polymerase-3 subunit epsilon